MTPEINPDNLTPEQLTPGYRFLRESEKENPPLDAEYWDERDGWVPRANRFGALSRTDTYQTRSPLPESERENPPAPAPIFTGWLPYRAERNEWVLRGGSAALNNQTKYQLSPGFEWREVAVYPVGQVPADTRDEEIATLKADVAALQSWKDSMLVIESKWDIQKLAKELGATLGEDCREVIVRESMRLKVEVARLKADTGCHYCKHLLDATNMTGIYECPQCLANLPKTLSVQDLVKEVATLRGELAAARETLRDKFFAALVGSLTKQGCTMDYNKNAINEAFTLSGYCMERRDAK